MPTTKRGDFDRLDDENYTYWGLQMQSYLDTKSFWDITSGGEPEPLNNAGQPARTSKAWKDWDKKRRNAMSEITLALMPSQMVHVVGLTTPKAMWDALRAHHETQGLQSRMALRRLFFKLSKQPNESMKTWITRVETAALRLTRIGAPLHDEDVLMVLTESLPPAYAPTVALLDQLDGETITNAQGDLVPALTLSVAKMRLKNAEAANEPELANAVDSDHHEAGGASDNALYGRSRNAPAAKTMSKPLLVCHTCGGRGHYARDCPTELDRSAYVDEVNANLPDTAQEFSGLSLEDVSF